MRSIPRWAIPMAIASVLLLLIAYYGTRALEKAALPTVGSLSIQVKAKDAKTLVVNGTYMYSNSTMNLNPSVTVSISNNGGLRLQDPKDENDCTVTLNNAVRCPIPSRQRGKTQTFSFLLVSSAPITQCMRIDAFASTGETDEALLNCKKKEDRTK